MKKFSLDKEERESCWILYCVVSRYAQCHNTLPYKGLIESLEAEHPAKKMHPIFFQIHDHNFFQAHHPWRTAVDPHLCFECMKDHSMF